jgi:hypothetical protein
MSEDRRDLEIGAWLDREAPPHAPDRLRDAIREELVQTRQEGAGAWLAARRIGSSPIWTAAAAVLLVVVGALAGGFFATRAQTGNAIDSPRPSVSPSVSTRPSASPTVTPTPEPTVVGVAASGLVRPRFAPSLEVTVPAGWVVSDDRPAAFRVSPPDAGFLRQGDGADYFDAVALYGSPVAGAPDGVLGPVAGVGTTAKDLATWLSTRPQLTATTPIPATLAGRKGYRLDFRLSPAAGELCTLPCVNLLFGPGSPEAYAFGIEGPWTVRAWLLDGPGGATIMATIEDVNGDASDAEFAAAEPILRTLAFVP